MQKRTRRKFKVTHNLETTTVSPPTYINMLFEHKNLQFVVYITIGIIYMLYVFRGTYV